MKILYFTATGNSLYVAKRFGGELISITQAVKSGNYEFSDDKIGIIFPVYGMVVPQYIEEFLVKAKLHSPYVFAVLTYGMLAGFAEEDLCNIAKKNEIHISYINKIRMVDNYLPNFNMEKQIRTESKKEIARHIDAIMKDVNHSTRQIPGISLLGKRIIPLAKDRMKIGRGVSGKFVVEDTCVRCGICAVVCPMDNIVFEDNKERKVKPNFGLNCMSCLACTQNCPQNAIRLRKEKSKSRFRNQHISLKEIEEANR